LNFIVRFFRAKVVIDWSLPAISDGLFFSFSRSPFILLTYFLDTGVHESLYSAENIVNLLTERDYSWIRPAGFEGYDETERYLRKLSK
jgi:hypothetical protein